MYKLFISVFICFMAVGGVFAANSGGCSDDGAFAALPAQIKAKVSAKQSGMYKQQATMFNAKSKESKGDESKFYANIATIYTQMAEQKKIIAKAYLKNDMESVIAANEKYSELMLDREELQLKMRKHLSDIEKAKAKAGTNNDVSDKKSVSAANCTKKSKETQTDKGK